MIIGKNEDSVTILPPLQRKKVKQLLKKCWITVAFLIISAAVISSLVRALTPWATQYKTEIEAHLSSMIGETVTIKAVETGWYWFEPVIKLKDVSVSDGKKDVVNLSKLLVGINLFSSLWHWQIQPGILFIDDLDLSVRQTKKGWQIEGIDNSENTKISYELAAYEPLLAWILAQQKIIIKNLKAQIHMADGSFIPLNQFNLHVVNQTGKYTIKGKGILQQTTATNFQFLADLNVDPYALKKSSGHVFFAVQDLLPTQWQGFAPPSTPFKVLGGKGNIQLWADLSQGKFQHAQANIKLRHLAWIDKQSKKNQLIQTIKANLAWETTKEGWQLSGDHVQLRLGNTRWPENSFLLRYQSKEPAYFVYIKNVIIDSLLSLSLPWPDAFSPILAMNPQGYFHDSQIRIKNNTLDYILTRFSALKWQSQNQWPSVRNLSGVLHWQPNTGELRLAGKKTVIIPNDYPPLKFSVIDTAFAWEKLSDGLKINMHRFLINHPNININAAGTLSQYGAGLPSQLALKGQFSANNVQRLMNYLPRAHLKPKLVDWLKHDVKRIGKLAGSFALNGPSAAFPYDKEPGEFWINSHLSGVDLVFAPHWPLTKAIEGYLRVNKRNLEADIVNANLKGIVVNNGNLRVDDIGLDKETLLIHSKISANSDKALAYVLSSPLSQKLSVLTILKMQGLLDLDLQLEAPLYPENDTILAFGDLNFNNNQVTVHHSLHELNLKDLNGSLQFDQQGVLDSNFKAFILNTPADLVIKSIHSPKPYTQVNLAWQTTMAILHQKFDTPLFALMEGPLSLNSVLKLTDDPNDLDHFLVRSSLEGVSIDLPPPYGKAKQTKAPLTIDFDFNPKKEARLRINYDNRLSSYMLYGSKKEIFALRKGEIRLGSGKAQEQNHDGLQVIGFLPYFDIEQWLNIKDKLSSNGNDVFFDALNRVDVKLEQAKLWKEQYNKVAIKAEKQKGGDWSIRLNHALVAGNLRYKPSSHTLSGVLEKLRLKNQTLGNKSASTARSKLKPTDLPNLDLKVSSFKFGMLDLGELSLKTRATPNRWKLDNLKIKTLNYEFSAQGEWKQNGEHNSTKMQANMHFNDLAASLEQWKITPAVEAHYGDLNFEGGWAGSLPDFSLAKVKGQMSIVFKDGRITHLSPETEGKLGLGKLLSILSLQTIPRRIKLDFSDLAKDGYSFDKFQGNFNILNGVMTTQDSFIDGPVAFAQMKGNLDIAKQLYDVDLNISPHITASLPIVATIAGGPIAGFATWVASKIITQGMQKISGYTYKVTGPWHQPVVQQVSIIKKQMANKKQKAASSPI